MKKFEVSLTMQVEAKNKKAAIETAAAICGSNEHPCSIAWIANEIHSPYYLVINVNKTHDYLEEPDLCLVELTQDQVARIDRAVDFVRKSPQGFNLKNLSIEFESKFLSLPEDFDENENWQAMVENVSEDGYALLECLPDFLKSVEERENLNCHEAAIGTDGYAHFTVCESWNSDVYETDEFSWLKITGEIVTLKALQ